MTREQIEALLKDATPGPWGLGRTGPEQRMILGNAGSGRYVAQVQIHQTPRHMGEWMEPEREGNARLIVAAPDLARTALDALAEVERLRASIMWVGEIYPSRIEAGGAGIEITWEEFNAMQAAAGVKVDARIGSQEGRAHHNHVLRVRAKDAEAERDAARAEVERLRKALLMWDDLIKHTYHGSREAMSDMTEAAQHTAKLLKLGAWADTQEAKE